MRVAWGTMLYWLVAIVLFVVGATFLFLGFQKRNDPDEQQKATTFIIIGFVAVLLLVLINLTPLGNILV